MYISGACCLVWLQHQISRVQQAELKAAQEKGITVTGELENARRQCKVHELEARDAVARALKSEAETKRAHQEAAKVTTVLDKATAQRTALQQQLKESQALVTVCSSSTPCALKCLSS